MMRVRTLSVAALVAMAATITAAGPANAGAATAVTIEAGQGLATVGANAIGADTPFWNGELLDPRTPGLIRRAGITKLDFDAGGPIDLYHWKTNTISPDPGGGANPIYAYLKPEYTFDQFERVAKAAGASTMVHVNYGTGPDSTAAKPTPGDPAEAAAWVRYANRVRHDNVRYWAVGEETYLDGIGEPDGHAAKTPQEYGKNLIAYSKAMKRVDQSIKVGAEMWAVNPADTKGSSQKAHFLRRVWEWDKALLKTPGIGHAMDFTDIHWLSYGDQTDDQILAVADGIRPAFADLRQRLDAIRGAHPIEIVAGEVNSAAAGAPQQSSLANALYLADNNLTLLENGATGVDWWALHSGQQGDEQHGFGDLALLSSGDCDSATNICAPPAQTPYPTYYGMQLFAAVATKGATLLASSSADAKVSAHATRRPDGSLAVLLINKDGGSSHRISLRLKGFTARSGATVLRYGQGSRHVERSYQSGPIGALTLSPLSITTLILRPAR